MSFVRWRDAVMFYAGYQWVAYMMENSYIELNGGYDFNSGGFDFGIGGGGANTSDGTPAAPSLEQNEYYDEFAVTPE